MLRRTPADKQAIEKALAIIERNAQSQNRIIGDILDVSRIVSGKLELELSSIDVANIVTEVVETLQPAARAKSITLTAKLPAEKALVAGDPGRLSQVFWNLVSNAVKFTREGGFVTLDVSAGPEMIEVAVEDNGVGIDPDSVPLIFERFRQLDSSIKRMHGGLGLGLAIVQHLVGLHNGSVDVRSDGAGRGTRFIVRLPAERGRSNGGEGSKQDVATDLSGLRILIVDDDADGLEITCLMLERFGAATRSAGTCAAALEIFDQWRPDVLVSDLGMPTEDGYDLISRIRKTAVDPKNPTPAIALSAYAGEKIRLRAIAAGYDADVAKPIDGITLAIEVKKILGTGGDRATLST